MEELSESTHDRSSRKVVELDTEGLRNSIISPIGWMLVIFGALGAWLVLPGPEFEPWRFVTLLSVCLEGVVILSLSPRHPRAAAVFLLLGPPVSLAIGLWAMPSAALPFFGVLIVVLNASIGPWAGVIAAALTTLAVLTSSIPPSIWSPAIILIWSTAVAEWISSRPLHTVLTWAWISQDRANRLLHESRKHQEELNRTVVALTEATRRLQRTRHELASARLHADRIRKLKERFAVNISHELRTPLNLILGFSETMFLTPYVYGDMEWPSLLKRDVHRVYQSSQQLLQLVNDVLDLSRLEGAEMPLLRERGDLRPVLQEAVDTIADLLRGRDELKLTIHVPPEMPLLDFDPGRIRQVLINLLNNAARFTERGTISVSIAVDEHEVVVSVADTGIGIPADELDKIFSEFYQIQETLRREEHTTGLGLAISQRFVRLHGGRIWAESTIGQGSVFHFSLPLSADAPPARFVLTDPIRPADSRYEQAVVLIESDANVGVQLSRYLMGYRVLQAEDLTQAAEMIPAWNPRAVLINVPPTTTLQDPFENALCVLPPSVPVILCTLPSQTWLAHMVGVRAWLTKPFTKQELLHHLERLGRIQEVLIVDDDRGVVQLISRHLQSARRAYNVNWAYDAEEALMQMRAETPDVILLDLLLPGMDGLALLQFMQNEPKLATIPVILVTAMDHAQTVFKRLGGMIAIERREGFGTLEVIRCLQMLLDAIEIVPVQDDVLERPASPSD